jgi:nucleotide-binding universal stress UspA family protein
MSYATLMVHVDVDAELAGRVNIAAGLADRFQAHLIGIAGWAPMSIFPVDGEPREPAESDFHLLDMRTLLDRKGQEFRAAVGTKGRSVEWRSILDFPTAALAREARAADLLIIGNRRENRDPFRALDPVSVLLKAGRPALVVPDSVTTFSPRHVAVAWKDAREARRAVQDALPFLQQAQSVMIVEVSEDDDGNRAQQNTRDVGRYLARHGVQVVTDRVRPAEVTVANSLLRLVEDENIDLIVAGAYGHSRLGEWAFGGVTRDLMTECGICCLFSS